MNQMKKFILFLILATVLGLRFGYSQEIISAWGGFFSNSAGMLSQTLGEPMIEKYSSTDVILTQGFEQSHMLASNLALQNISIVSGQTECYSATQVITVAGNGTTFEIQDGGSATLIAGSRISMLPDVHVSSGGYMLAKISTDYCTQQLNPLVINPVNPEERSLSPSTVEKSVWIKIYPNPTPGKVTLELPGDEMKSQAILRIYNMMGTEVLTQQLTGSKTEFSLESMPSGIYIVRVWQNEKMENAKIIRQ